MAFTENQDYAISGGQRFSDRPPGTALLAAPLYALSAIGPSPIVEVPSKHDRANPRLIYAVMTASLAASGTVALFYLILRQHFQLSVFSATLATLALAFGTITWKYGSVLYSHAQSSLLIFLTLYLIFRAERHVTIRWPNALALGFIVGLTPLMEYTNVVFVLIVGVYVAVAFYRPFVKGLQQPDTRYQWIASLIALGAGFVIPLAFLFAYNTLNFGGPFEISTFHADIERWPQNENLNTDFSTPLLVGLRGMLLYGDNNQGLFLLSPVAGLSLLGLLHLYRHSRRHFVLVVGTFVALLLLFSKSTTFNPYTNDGRYLTPFLGLWFIPFAFWIDRRFESAILSPQPLRRLAVSLLLYGLFFFSVRNVLMHIAFSWNYDLDPAQLRPMSIPPTSIWLILRTVFPNTPNLPILWGVEIVAFGLIWLASRWRDYVVRRRSRRSDTGQPQRV
jgi:hypothetical protein